MSTPSVLKFIAASLVLFVAASCVAWLAAAPPPLIDQVGDEGNPRDAAPIVVVGVLVSDTLVRRPVPQHSDPEYPLQLRKLRVRVENVLKGDVSAGTVPVYYFAFAGGFHGPQPLGMWSMASRRVLWLRRDAGVLRTTCDGWDRCTSPVYSGAHPDLRVDPSKSVDYAVADILLTRGEGAIDDNAFAAAFGRGQWGPEGYLIERYRRLAMTESSVVKAQACMMLWIYAQDPGVQSGTGKSAGDAMREANCACTTRSTGGLDCGPLPKSDPPW